MPAFAHTKVISKTQYFLARVVVYRNTQFTIYICLDFDIRKITYRIRINADVVRGKIDFTHTDINRINIEEFKLGVHQVILCKVPVGESTKFMRAANGFIIVTHVSNTCNVCWYLVT